MKMEDFKQMDQRKIIESILKDRFFEGIHGRVESRQWRDPPFARFPYVAFQPTQSETRHPGQF